MKGQRAAWALALVLAVASPAWAQPVDAGAKPDPAALAIEKGREGIALFERGQWEPALALFREADALFHSPVLVLYAARSQRNLGKLVEATSLYQALAKETFSPSAPPSWPKAQSDGAAELATLDKEIPRINVVVDGATPTTRITIDGVAASIGFHVAQDPGEHRVVVTDGTRELSKTITLKRNDGVQRVAFTLPSTGPATPPRPPEKGSVGWRVLGGVLTSVGGLSLIGGGIAGGSALAKSSSATDDLPETCTEQNSCPKFAEAEAEAQFSGAYTLASVADGLLIGGAITAAAGIVILIVDPGGTVATPGSAANGGGVQFTF